MKQPGILSIGDVEVFLHKLNQQRVSQK
jgi:hypothetical protein